MNESVTVTVCKVDCSMILTEIVVTTVLRYSRTSFSLFRLYFSVGFLAFHLMRY